MPHMWLAAGDVLVLFYRGARSAVVAEDPGDGRNRNNHNGRATLIPTDQPRVFLLAHDLFYRIAEEREVAVIRSEPYNMALDTTFWPTQV